MFEAFGFGERLIARPTGSTRRSSGGRIQRTAPRSCAPAASRTPRTACPSSRTSSSTRRACTTYLLEYMERVSLAAGGCPIYGIEFRRTTSMRIGRPPGRAVDLRAQRTARSETVRARYVVGCDGARSSVRESIGRDAVGDLANHAWGVMDVLAVTDFPDIRLKCAIQSADEGNILHHPARRRLPRPPLRRARRARPRRTRRQPRHHDRAADRGRATRSCIPTRST